MKERQNEKDTGYKVKEQELGIGGREDRIKEKNNKGKEQLKGNWWGQITRKR